MSTQQAILDYLNNYYVLNVDVLHFIIPIKELHKTMLAKASKVGKYSKLQHVSMIEFSKALRAEGINVKTTTVQGKQMVAIRGIKLKVGRTPAKYNWGLYK